MTYSKAGFPIERLDGELTVRALVDKAYELSRNREAYADALWAPRQCVDVFLPPELYRPMVSKLQEEYLLDSFRVCVVGDYVRLNLGGCGVALIEDHRLSPDACVMPLFPDIEHGVVVTPSLHWCWLGCRPVYTGDYSI